MSPQSMQLASYIVTAAATLGLFFVGGTQIILSVLDGRRRRGRLDAVARYYAMLVRRSVNQTLAEMTDLMPMDNREVWRLRTGRFSEGLARVAVDLREMVLASLERRGGTTAGLQTILYSFYAGAHEVNELAREEWGEDLTDRQARLQRASNELGECSKWIGGEFELPSPTTGAIGSSAASGASLPAR